MSVKCEICKHRESALHVQQIIGDEHVDMYLCESCAEAKGISKSDDKIELSISRLLSGLFGDSSGTEGADVETCPSCGTAVGALRSDGSLGCPDCYRSFAAELRRMHKKLSGSVQHVGKLPQSIRTYKEQVLDKRELRAQLDTAVQNEDYETAATLRDKLHEIDNGQR